MKTIIFIILYLSMSLSFAVDMPLEFEEPVKQQRYQSLLEEFRCLVCQNQTLAASPAGTAQDLRKVIYNMVNEDQPDEAIIDFLVARYGDFVLYNPRLNPSTVLLWFGPFLLLILALVVAYRYVNRSKVEDVAMTAGDRARVDELLKNTNNKENNI